MANADLILLDGRDITGRAIDLYVIGGYLIEVAPAGDSTFPRGPKTRVLSLGGRLVTPGLWDAHVHLYHWCLSRGRLSLQDMGSREEMLAALSGQALGTSWVLGHGWNTARWADPRLPHRKELDQVTGDCPTLLWCSDLHSAIANTAALEMAGLMHGTHDIPGGVVECDEDGTPNGWLKEMAANVVRDCVPDTDDDELARLLLEAQSDLHRWGVTGICDQRIKDQNEGPRLFRVLRGLEQNRCWQVRTSLNFAAHHLSEAAVLGLSTGFGSDRLRVGHLKIFADGTLGSRTARMLTPFNEQDVGEDGRGLYLTPPQEIEEEFRRAAEAGFSISIHAIGDEANRLCLDLFEGLDAQGFPRPKIPHRIEHAQFLDDLDLPRFKALNVTASVQPGHLLDDRWAADQALGARASLAYRFGDLRKAGALLAMGSDAPVSEIDPRYGVGAALSRRAGNDPAWYPEQCLDAESVLFGYTLGAATAAGWGDEVGSLRAGFRADLVVWDGDPFSQESGVRARVAYTIFDGSVVYSAEEDGV